MSKIALTPNATGTGVFTISSPATNTNRTLTLPDEAGTVLTSASSITQNAGPAFSAYKNATQAITTATFTKVLFQIEEFDTDSCFASSTFTPTVAGYYQAHVGVAADTTTTNTQSVIYKNGIKYKRLFISATNTQSELTCLVYLNGSTDYIEAYTFIVGTSPVISLASDLTFFQASMVRAA